MVAMPSDSLYEQARQQRIQENQKRLQELGIETLSENSRSSLIPPATPSEGGKSRVVVKEKVKVELRRSSRNSGCPRPEYREIEVDVRRRTRVENAGGPRHYSRLYERKYASDEARAGASNKAETIKEGLPSSNPSLVKPMLQSHVTGGFWLGLPVAFCRDYLPKDDTRIILEDENVEEWETAYLAKRTGLSAGWRGFSLDHGLVDGDALVFELVQPHRFKVYIVRAYEPGEECLAEEQQKQDCLADQQQTCVNLEQTFTREAHVETEAPESDEEDHVLNTASRKSSKFLATKNAEKEELTSSKPKKQRHCNEAKMQKKEDDEFYQEEGMEESDATTKEGGEEINEDTTQSGLTCGRRRSSRKRTRADNCEDEEGDGNIMKKPKDITSYLKSIKPVNPSVRVAELRKCSGRIEGC